MYARFEKLAAELGSSSDDGSEDELQDGNREAGKYEMRANQPSRPTSTMPMTNTEPAETMARHSSSAAFQSVKTHCVALLEASDVASRDSALIGIAAVFRSLARVEAESLVQFALMPVMILLRDMGKHPHKGGTASPLNVHKDRGTELALDAVRAIVQAGGARPDEVHAPIFARASSRICLTEARVIWQAIDILLIASRMIGGVAHCEVDQSAAKVEDAGKNEFELRASEQVVSAALNTITDLLQAVNIQGAMSDSGGSGLSRAWEVRSASGLCWDQGCRLMCFEHVWWHVKPEWRSPLTCRQPHSQDQSPALGFVLASMLAVSKAADVVGAQLSEQAIQAVELLFKVAQVSASPA